MLNTPLTLPCARCRALQSLPYISMGFTKHAPIEKNVKSYPPPSPDTGDPQLFFCVQFTFFYES